MQNTLIDNSNEKLSMVYTLKECLSQNVNHIRIATGYWDIPGTALIADELETFLQKEGAQLQLLIGKDPYVYASQVSNPIFKDANYPQDFIKADIDSLANNLKDEYKKVIKLLLEYCKGENPKFQIRIYKKNEEGEAQFLHSKCYIFTNDPQKVGACGIIGSSNFTQKGLEGNAELNYLETNSMVVTYPQGDDYLKGHVAWFDEKWEISEDWTEIFLEQILKKAEPVQPIIEEEQPEDIAPLTPYELRIKLLQQRFGDLVDKDLSRMIEDYLPNQYMPLTYQLDAVKQCFSTMHEHGGFMLADVVGLGKTIVGTLVIKHFLSFANDDNRERKVLLIVPPAIRQGWVDTIADFDKDSEDKIADKIDIITTGRVDRFAASIIDDDDLNVDDDAADTGDFDDQLKQELYGLVIIDESHKFRNSTTIMYQALDQLIDHIFGETGTYPYVGLLSATPQNNRPDDLKNQIYLFERNHSDSTLKKAEGGNLEGFFAQISRRYRELVKNDAITEKERTRGLITISSEIRDKVLCDILVRRTRTDVKKYYADDVEKQNLVFPEIKGPNMLEYVMSSSLARLFAQSMEVIAPDLDSQIIPMGSLGYYRYKTIAFIKKPEIQKLYTARNMGVDRYTTQLAKIMQILLVKRLESSFTAFKASLHNLQRYSQTMIEMWENDKIYICPLIDVNKEFAPMFETVAPATFADCAKNVDKKIKRLNEQGRNEQNRNRVFRRSDFDPSYIDLLKEDMALINSLCNAWDKQTADPKLDAFRKSLLPVLFDKELNRPQLLVVFTEAVDTANKLTEIVRKEGLRPLTITAQNRDREKETIRANFDANYKDTQLFDYDVIITTEVLAEGVNLHRANTILNYDTPWNSTRLMQRIGRVNRIGSSEPFVYVYNFMPSAQGDAEITLVKKAHAKIQSFHTLFGEDSKIFTESEQVMNYELAAGVDEEESPMEKYVYELKQYKAANEVRYDQILNTEDNLQFASSEQEGNYYYVIRNNVTTAMYAKYSCEAEEAIVLSTSEMFEEFNPSREATRVEQMPADWEKASAAATRIVNQQLHRLSTQMGNSNRATEAKQILRSLDAALPRTEENKQMKKLLSQAFTLANRGNSGIIRIVLSYANQHSEIGTTLFDITTADLENTLLNYIGRIIKQIETKNGKAEVYLALAK